ncbi:MAG: SprT-like domain-containing protein [Bacteroidales bacterium]
MQARHKEILSRYFPAGVVEQVADIIVKNRIQLRFTAGRNTKLGDYRPPGSKVSAHRITLNGNLNPWFLYLVFIHEYAHLLVWNKYQNRVSPHGQQWKEEFASLLRQQLYQNSLPESIARQVLDFCKNPRATFASHAPLWKALKTFDAPNDNEVLVADLPVNAYFVAANGKIFQKEERVKTRYRCYCVNNKRRYLFHPMAGVQPLEGEHVLQQALQTSP